MNELSSVWNDRQLMTNVEETTHQHFSLLLVVLGQGFILFFNVVILLFLPRRDEDSLSITLPASSLFFDCSSSGEVLLFPEVAVISLHLLFITPSPWACPALIFSSILWSLFITEANHVLWTKGRYCAGQSVSASLLLFVMRSQSWISVPVSNYSLSLSLSLILLPSLPLFSHSLWLPTLFPLLCSVSLIWSPWFSLSECLFV